MLSKSIKTARKIHFRLKWNLETAVAILGIDYKLLKFGFFRSVFKMVFKRVSESRYNTLKEINSKLGFGIPYSFFAQYIAKDPYILVSNNGKLISNPFSIIKYGVDSIGILESVICYNPNCHPNAPNALIESSIEIGVKYYEDVTLIKRHLLIDPTHYNLLSYDHNVDYLSGESAGIQGCFKNVCEVSKRVDLDLVENLSHYYIEQDAIYIGGRTAANYFHWVFEYLAKLEQILKLPNYEEYTLVVSDNMPSQHYELLKLLLPKNPVLLVKFRDVIKFKNLIIPTIPNVFLDKLELEEWQDNIRISPKAMIYLRNAILDKLNLPTKKRHRKIYLARHSRTRSIVNIKEFEKLLDRLGFEFVRADKLSFADQVSLFLEAKIVVGAAGASFTNMLFLDDKAQAIIVTASHFSARATFSTIGHIVGCNVVILPGKASTSELSARAYMYEKHYVFDTYFVDLKELEEQIKLVS